MIIDAAALLNFEFGAGDKKSGFVPEKEVFIKIKRAMKIIPNFMGV
jgi:hypothetical protein